MNDIRRAVPQPGQTILAHVVPGWMLIIKVDELYEMAPGKFVIVGDGAYLDGMAANRAVTEIAACKNAEQAREIIPTFWPLPEVRQQMEAVTWWAACQFDGTPLCRGAGVLKED